MSFPADCRPLSLCPQSSQKSASGSFSVPQFGQRRTAGFGSDEISFPHSGQNFEFSGTKAPQFSQYIFQPLLSVVNGDGSQALSPEIYYEIVFFLKHNGEKSIRPGKQHRDPFRRGWKSGMVLPFPAYPFQHSIHGLTIRRVFSPQRFTIIVNRLQQHRIEKDEGSIGLLVANDSNSIFHGEHLQVLK